MGEIKFRAYGTDNSEKPRMIYDWQDCELIENFGFSGGYNFTIMQYTGLKDKNGKEIYEGDVVKYYPAGDKIGKVAAVEWGEFEDCCVEGETWILSDKPWQPTIWHYANYENSNEREIEIIGNIYENPELIK